MHRPAAPRPPSPTAFPALALLAVLMLFASGAVEAQPPIKFQFEHKASGKGFVAKKTPAEEPKGFEEARPIGEKGEVARIASEQSILTDDNVAYGMGRTTVSFKGYSITADRMSVDWTTSEVQAEGDVILVGEKEEVHASSVRYNFRVNEGVAWDVHGEFSQVFFRTEWDEEANGPSFRQVSEKEALFRGASYTACNFPVPHYYVTAREVILLVDDRVFMRDAVLYIRGVPCLYFPFYTRAFHDPSPWSFEFGITKRYGPYMRIGYDYVHSVKVPGWEDPKHYRTRTNGHLGLRTDLFWNGAAGAGAVYKYKFDFERHLGTLELYGIRDRVRSGSMEYEEGAPDRWTYRHRHNSMMGRTIFQLNADWMSDSDIYQDVLDRFSDQDRGRMPERRMRAALTYVREDWLARVMFELKDRITRSRYQDFTEPYDDDLNYDPDPDFKHPKRNKGIPNTRYGRVSEKYQGRAATRMLEFMRTPFYYKTEFNVLRNRDPGFNEKDTADDAFVQGSDIYGSLTHRTRLGERFTWMNTLGVGASYYDRDNEELVASRTFHKHDNESPPTIDGHRYKHRDTVLLGSSEHEMSYRDVDPAALWADYTSRLNARFTDTLEGYLKYTYRAVTQDSTGLFYRETGRVEAFDDVYDFPVAYHWIEGFLNYHLLYPDLDVYLTAGENLAGDGDVFANERRRYVAPGMLYRNDTNEFTSTTEFGYEERQQRDMHDPNEFTQRGVVGRETLKYVPKHGRWWTEVKLTAYQTLEDDPVARSQRKRDRFDENEPQYSVAPLYGKQLGPKYAVELSTEYDSKVDGLKRYGVTVKRDLHDAVLSLFFGMKRNTFADRNDKDGKEELEVRASLQIKQPKERASLGANSIKTLKDKDREATYVN